MIPIPFPAFPSAPSVSGSAARRVVALFLPSASR